MIGTKVYLENYYPLQVLDSQVHEYLNQKCLERCHVDGSNAISMGFATKEKYQG